MEKTRALEKNLKLYNLSRMLVPLTIWGIMVTIFYKERGLSFADIAIIQSIGSIFSIVIDIPTGILADRFGDKFFIVLSALFYSIACVVMIFSYHFMTFLIAEFLFGIGTACMSGAASSFLYKNIREMGRLDDYRKIKSEINRRQVPIRMASRLIAPILYSLYSESVFIISAVVYVIILFLYLQFDERFLTKTVQEKVHEESKLKEKIFNLIIKYKNFIILSILSLIFFTIISNFLQYFSNQVEEIGFNIAFLGVLHTIRACSGYLSNMIAPKIKKEHTWRYLFLLPALLALLLIILYFSYNIYTMIFAFIASEFIQTPFMILLTEKIHNSVDDSHRNTMLAISNQFDNFSTLAFDPLIGYSLDKIGFRLTYFYMAVILLFVIGIIYFYFKNKKS